MKERIESLGATLIMVGVLVFFAVLLTSCENSQEYVKGDALVNDVMGDGDAAKEDAVILTEADGAVVAEADEADVVVADVVDVEVADGDAVVVDETGDEDVVVVPDEDVCNGTVIEDKCFLNLEMSATFEKECKAINGHVADIDELKVLLYDCTGDSTYGKLGGVTVTCHEASCYDSRFIRRCNKIYLLTFEEKTAVSATPVTFNGAPMSGKPTWGIGMGNVDSPWYIPIHSALNSGRLLCVKN